jgi:hypothetical protein
MAFAANPRKFTSERSKVMYAASFLTSVALAWFEPYLFLESEEESPSFLSSFASFEDELIKTFGDPDAEATAEHKLNSIKMKEDQEVNRYITEFRKYQLQVNWDDRSLMFCFRKGLPSRILDELARMEEKPKTLNALQQAALRIDLRFWERQQERKEFGEKAIVPQHQRNQVKPQSNSPHRFAPRFGTSNGSTSQSSSSSSNSSTTTNDKKEKKYPYLNAKGKLTTEEKERRKKNSLCMYCGAPNHSQADCPNKKDNQKPKPSYSIKAASTLIDSSNQVDTEDDEQAKICATFTIANPQTKN